MQHLRQQVEALEYNLVETKNELRKVSGSLDLVEQHIDKIQRQLELSHDWPHTEDTAAGRDQDQTVDRLWQELNRLGNKEDRLRQEKLIIVQLELTLYEALLQLQSRQDLQQDIEAGGRICKHEDPITGPQYCITVRLIPPCMIVCFLIGLFAWFGVDVQKKTEGLSTTQKVASIGSASFTIMTIVALFVRAAMCTGEWQWILQMCGNVTGWSQLTSLQRQQPVVKDKLPVIATAPALPFQASSKADNALGSECIASAGNINVPSSPSSVDSSTFEEWKKK